MNDLEIALVEAQREYGQAVAHRTNAIVEAVRGDVSMRRVAELANCSREEVRRITKSIAVTYVLDGTDYELTQDQTRVLAYKATGFAAGAFPGDVERLGAGDAWLTGARDLARDLERVRQGLVREPVELSGDTAHALYQILRLTYLGRRTRLTDLWDALAQRFNST